MLYICKSCGEIFDEMDLPSHDTTYAKEYGADDPYGYRLTVVDEYCPYCHGDIEEYVEEDEEIDD